MPPRPPAKRPAKKPAAKVPSKRTKKPAAPEPDDVDEAAGEIDWATLSETERHAALRKGLLDDAWKLHTQMFAPMVRKEVKVTSLGEGITEAEVIEVDLVEPTFADKKLIVGAISGIVEKIHALTPGRGAAGDPTPAGDEKTGGS